MLFSLWSLERSGVQHLASALEVSRVYVDISVD